MKLNNQCIIQKHQSISNARKHKRVANELCHFDEGFCDSKLISYIKVKDLQLKDRNPKNKYENKKGKRLLGTKVIADT